MLSLRSPRKAEMQLDRIYKINKIDKIEPHVQNSNFLFVFFLIL